VAARLATGQPPGKVQSCTQPERVSQRYIFGMPGRTIRGLPAIPPGAFGAWHKAPGYTCQPVRSHADRLGMVMVTGDYSDVYADQFQNELEAAIEYE
jgi:hypothetical protein